MKNMGERDSFASKELVEIAKLLESVGYNVHGIEIGDPPKDYGDEVGFFFTVKLSRYAAAKSGDAPEAP